MKNSKKLIFGLMIFLFIIVLVKIYEVHIMNKAYQAMEEFKNEENRYYSVIIALNDNKRRDEIFAKNRTVKSVITREERVLRLQWKDFKENNQILINSSNEIAIRNEKFLPNIPNLICFLKTNNRINFNKILEIYYIIPIKYEDKNCYKIMSKKEELIIDKTTYLPVYSKTRVSNTETEENKSEYMYEFKIGGVTDEDVAYPNLEDYNNIEESKQE